MQCINNKNWMGHCDFWDVGRHPSREGVETFWIC